MASGPSVRASQFSRLETRGLGKSFAGVEVLHDVDFAIGAASVHALVGENGAGKSTFSKLLAGIHRPSRGEILLDGMARDVTSPLEAQRLGITMIHQEPVSFPDLSVAENLAIGRTGRGPFSRVRWRNVEVEARRVLATLDADIDIHAPMRGLSIADQQTVEIARALVEQSQLIIMDEPTAPLTPREVDTLFRIVRSLRDEGRSILLISHRLEEVRELCDAITVLRDGRWVLTAPMTEISDDQIIESMIGRLLQSRSRSGTATTKVALSVRKLSSPSKFEDISFDLHAGEVLGVAGLVGAGRTDVARALFGLAPAMSGSIRISDRAVTVDSPSTAIRHGMAYVPEDRATAGIFATMPVEANITATMIDRISTAGIIGRRRETDLADEAVAMLGIRHLSPDQPIIQLSGGNQQKAILARWLLKKPSILILDEPTRGIDIGVKAEFYDRIGQLAASGHAVLLISSDLPEILTLSDRILVLCEGRLAATLSRAEASQAAIMRAAVPPSKIGLAA